MVDTHFAAFLLLPSPGPGSTPSPVSGVIFQLKPLTLICVNGRIYGAELKPQMLSTLFSCLFQRRVVLLSQEMDAGLQAWQLRQQEKLQEEEGKQKNALKSKGALLQNPQPSQ